MESKRNFIAKDKNTGFICQNCKFENIPLHPGIRNHCVKCLYSLHVDESLPGDRKSKCKGPMRVKSIEYNGKKGYILIHECIDCGKLNRNKVAIDDDFDQIIKIS